LTAPFWLSGSMKLVGFEAGMAEMTRIGLQPAAAFNAAVILTQIVSSIAIISNRGAWLGAAALAIFTALTIPLVHHFWAITEEPFRTIAMHTASEHVGIIGGLLAVAVLSANVGGRDQGVDT
jgi:transmembrane protein